MLVWLVWLTKKALKLELQSLNVVFLKKPFQNQSSKKTLYKYDYYAEMGGIPVKFFFRSYTKINFMAKVGISQLWDWHILSKKGTMHTKMSFTLTLTHDDLLQNSHNIYILGKKALLGHGSTRVMSSNTVCRALNLFKLLYLLNWKHFYRKKLIFEEVALKKWKFLISEGDFRPKFIKMSATSSKINFFQEKCFQFIRYNKLKRFRALQTVFEDMPLVLPCPIDT